MTDALEGDGRGAWDVHRGRRAVARGMRAVDREGERDDTRRVGARRRAGQGEGASVEVPDGVVRRRVHAAARLDPRRSHQLEERGAEDAEREGSRRAPGGKRTPIGDESESDDEAATKARSIHWFPYDRVGVGERRSLRTLPVASLHPLLPFNTRPRRLSTPTDAFQLHPDVRFVWNGPKERAAAREREEAKTPERDHAERVLAASAGEEETPPPKAKRALAASAGEDAAADLAAKAKTETETAAKKEPGEDASKENSSELAGELAADMTKKVETWKAAPSKKTVKEAIKACVKVLRDERAPLASSCAPALDALAEIMTTEPKEVSARGGRRRGHRRDGARRHGQGVRRRLARARLDARVQREDREADQGGRGGDDGADAAGGFTRDADA